MAGCLWRRECWAGVSSRVRPRMRQHRSAWDDHPDVPFRAADLIPASASLGVRREESQQTRGYTAARPEAPRQHHAPRRLWRSCRVARFYSIGSNLSHVARSPLIEQDQRLIVCGLTYCMTGLQDQTRRPGQFRHRGDPTCGPRSVHAAAHQETAATKDLLRSDDRFDVANQIGPRFRPSL